MFVVEKKAVSDYVLLYLRKEIMLKKFDVGFHLKESEISKSLKVSRGPVREALTHLQKEGLVEKNINGRAVVCEFSQKDIKNLYNARILIEKAALSEIKRSTFLNNIEKFNEIIEGMKEPDKHNEVDMSFHMLIIKLSQNKTLEQLWCSLRGVTLTLMEITNEYLYSINKVAIEEHKNIIRNMKNGNLNEAQLALEKHLQNAAQHFTNAVEDLNIWR